MAASGFSPPAIDFGAMSPSIVVIVAALVVLLAGLFLPERAKGTLATLSIVGLIGGLVATLVAGQAGVTGANGMLVLDGFAVFIGVIILGAGIVTVLLSDGYVGRQAISTGEYYALLLFACAGMLLVVSAADLIMILLGIEILSIALYVLAGFSRGRDTSEESALKYFLLGAFSLSFMIYGSALLFGVAKSTRLATIATVLAQGARPSLIDSSLVLAGVALILVGFAFKLSFAPFHMWTPDAYEGAPTPITAFMSVATKAAVFAALLRFLTFAIPTLQPEWTMVLAALAVLTMVIGNIAAVVQSRVKRLLAYSSIAQAGYILIGVLAGNAIGGASVLFYLLGYAITNIGAFAVLMAIGDAGDSDPEVADFDGLGRRSPLLAFAMTVFMLGLAGIPLTAGFMSKLYVFTAGVQAGLIDLVIVGVITSAIATFYYLRIVVAMYFRGPAPAPIALRTTGALTGLIVVLAIGTIALGVLPAGPLGFAASAVAQR
ncbi:MAG: NADH-quinone oxidoreductase subunit N [Chloroflexota bacterium]|nr:MAG: NADH-quinone oxidoreductase subunit N [Chloroflexota bacterium]